MNHTHINRIVAAGVLLVTLTVYMMTLSPTVVFWDVGEFIGAAKLLQVPHPPGSPLFLLGARVAMMIPFVADQAVRAHALSAALSALAIMFFYLTIVEFFRSAIDIPEALGGKLAFYGSAAIGSLALAFSPTYWDNSIEAEVYGASMFFLTAIIWIAMRWRARADEQGNERYVLLIAYLIGLSLGVHLLSLLVIFPVLMIIFFRKYEVTFKSFLIFAGVALGIFFVVYPGIVKFLPGMMDGDFAGTKSDIIAWLPWLIIAAVCYGVYVTYVNRQKMANVALLSVVLVLLGYTTYTQVIIRANVQPPMNENNPNNLARLTSYLGREQYGNAPVFMPRRWSAEPQHREIYTRYTSDLEYMFSYQINHMFLRYLGWNFVGSAGDYQDAGVSAKDTWAIPFLIGLFGVYYQARRDWKMGLVLLTMFIILGPVLALYQNQQEPQPRERDYFYVGAYLVMATWIAYGVYGLVDLLRQVLKPGGAREAVSFGVVGALALAIPVNMYRVNHHEHDRTGNYLAWDYSYNMLQTCEKDAILFTNGDNDTFPLWYLQDVEGIRRDVRIVNLSLGNTPWYIQQMKDKPYYAEAQAVPISIPDAQIANIEPIAWRTRRVELPVPPEVFKIFNVTDTSLLRKGKIEFTVDPTLRSREVRGVRVQDLLVLNIIETNHWKRPIYFATTCAPDSKIGLDHFLWFEGLAYRLEPRISSRDGLHIDPEILEVNLTRQPSNFSRTPQYGYIFRGTNDSNVHFDETATRLLSNLRMSFVELANYDAMVKGDNTKAAEILDRMDFLIPRSRIQMGWDLESDLAVFYRRIGRDDRFNEYMSDLEPRLLKMVDDKQYNMKSYYNPFRVLLDLYEYRRDYGKSIDMLNILKTIFPQDTAINKRIEALQARVHDTTLPDSTKHP